MNFRNIITILVRPENPDNIGAVARALKNMGFSRLRLVRPPSGWRVRGKKMAMSAADLLSATEVFSSLHEAVQDLGHVAGMTRRGGAARGTFLGFDDAIGKVRTASSKMRIGVVFGCESKGLANEDTRLCDVLVSIPSGKAYPSLNLAQAVMVTLFSVARQKNATKSARAANERPLSKKEIAAAVEHFERALRALGYREGGADLLPRILATFRGILKRSGLSAPEAQMIKGLSRRIREKVLDTPEVPIE
jgi:TrmH family RNA methyltransferase